MSSTTCTHRAFRIRFLFPFIVLAALAGSMALPAAASAEPSIVGIWEGQIMDQTLGMPMYVQLVAQADGSYTCMAQTSMSMSRHWGTWSQGQGYLRLTIEGGEPTEYCGPLGCNPIIWPEGETWPVQWLNSTSFQTTGGTMYRVQ